uniref:dynein-1-alpha heavy chain, flagellar inner arm I1 complex-like n=1 Tax=Ciona intestinalis TaxID=7719 RepID=UPI00089DCC71|nr:dynein-1-alpha heavy chain, flagellar inner arm I1 complex-like [Ciona intestinalis]|eukprot:XP_018668708.1 dynein-1-alpha heavy chain, flagellar inner arm I1 complex-like [Ciona intestinalis]
MDGVVIAVLSISLILLFLVKTLILILLHRSTILKCCQNKPEVQRVQVDRVKVNAINAWEEKVSPQPIKVSQIFSVCEKESLSVRGEDEISESDLETLSFVENERIAEAAAKKELEESEIRSVDLESKSNTHEINPTEAILTNQSENNKEKRKNDLINAITNRDIEKLERAIEWAIFDGYDVALREEIYEARERMKQEINLERMRESVKNMKQSVISELRSYSKPPKAVRDVMMCVYLLLQVRKEDEIKTWLSIQRLMSLGGRNCLKRLIETFRADDVSCDVTARVKELLGNYDFQHIYEVSEGAAVFYVWIMEVIEEVEALKGEDIKSATD